MVVKESSDPTHVLMIRQKITTCTKELVKVLKIRQSLLETVLITEGELIKPWKWAPPLST